MEFFFMGHATQPIAIAAHLMGRGHTPGICVLEGDLSARIRAAGIDGPIYAPPVAPRSAVERSARGKSFLERAANPAWYRRWLQYVLLDQVDRQVPEVRRAAESFEPDLICTDSMAYAGAIVAEALGVRWAGLATQLAVLAPADWRYP